MSCVYGVRVFTHNQRQPYLRKWDELHAVWHTHGGTKKHKGYYTKQT